MFHLKRLKNLDREEINNYWVSEGPTIIFMLLFWAANLGVFAERFYHYWMGPGRVVFDALGHGVTFARATGATLKFNSACILIPVSRNLLSWLRGTWVSNYINIDKNITFHKHVAWLIMWQSVIHCFGHFFNYLNLSKLSGDQLRLIKLNPYVDGPPSPWRSLFFTPAGITGLVVSICMVLMYSSAVEQVRRPYFEAFWYTHHLFVIYYVGIALHGIAEVLEPATFWIWTIGPFSLYMLERSIRQWRGSQDTILLLAVAHPSKVLELQMQKSSFKFKAGQYLFLNCPFLSKHEWHPFTITAAPEEDFVSVHIRIVGDWTGKLWRLLNSEQQLGVVQENLLTAPNGASILRIDGPFGTASEEAFDFENLMLIGAGIGVTPFASILKSVKYRLMLAPHGTKLRGIKKVHFFWISRDRSAFEWFNDLLAALEQENYNTFLSIHIYFTGGLKEKEVQQIADAEKLGENDPITGLHARTHYGRPNWEQIFTDIAHQHPHSEVGVFFCGPAVLSKNLRAQCLTHTSSAVGGCRFVYHKENF